MIVLSLFDGMSCGREALKRAGVKVTKYYASEIDKHAITVAKKNHPDIEHLGDVNDWREWDIEKPDLIIGGSPCQGFSFAGEQLAFDDPRSALFFTMMDIIDHYQPQYRYLENVKMAKKHLAVITRYMGCDPHLMNSALVSAQNRERYYWANWRITQPEDKGIKLIDILERHEGEAYGCAMRGREDPDGIVPTKQFIEVREDDKANCLTLSEKTSMIVFVRPKSKTVRCSGRSSKDRHEWDSVDDSHKRKFTVTECERLQTANDGYTSGVSKTQRFRMLGNGWTIDMIAHHFSTLGEPIDPQKEGRLL